MRIFFNAEKYLRTGYKTGKSNTVNHKTALNSTVMSRHFPVSAELELLLNLVLF